MIVMAQRKVTNPAHAGTGHSCGECASGEWNTNDFNYRGEPFEIYCEQATFAYNQRRGCGMCLASTQACEHFKAGERPSWRTKGGNHGI